MTLFDHNSEGGCRLMGPPSGTAEGTAKKQTAASIFIITLFFHNIAALGRRIVPAAGRTHLLHAAQPNPDARPDFRFAEMAFSVKSNKQYL